MVGTNLGKCEWVWERNTKMAESKLAKFKMPEFKMAAIITVEWEWISLSQIELVWVRVRVESECFWVNLREDNKVSESKMAVAELIFGRIQDSCHHQVKWEWMSLNQIEIVWVRVRVEWECFWVNLREDNKVSESKKGSVWIQHGRIQNGCHLQVQWEWMSKVYFVQNGFIHDGRPDGLPLVTWMRINE